MSSHPRLHPADPIGLPPVGAARVSAVVPARLLPVACSVVPVLGCAAWVLATDPTDASSQQGPCVIKLFTGWDCPLCGGTRMVWSLLHGNLAGAFLDNAMALAVLPLVVYVWLSWAVERLGTGRGGPGSRQTGRRESGRQQPEGRRALPVGALTSPRFWLGIAVLWLVFTVLRNLPAFSVFYV